MDIKTINKLKSEAKKRIYALDNERDLKKVKSLFFSRKNGKVTQLMKEMENISFLAPKERFKFGRLINNLRDEIQEDLRIKAFLLKHGYYTNLKAKN